MLPSSCPFCEHANPAGAKFCNDCGSPLYLAPCRHCGAVNNVDDAQCYKCGRSTARALADAMLVDAQLHEVEERLRGFEHRLDGLEEPAPGVERESTAKVAAPPVLREVDVPVLEEQAQAQAVMPESRDVGVREPASPVRERSGDIRESRDFEIREPVLRVNERYEAAPRQERHRVAAALVAVIALAVPAGGYVYYELAPRLTVGSGGQVVLASPEPPAASRIDAAVEQRASAPASPIAALSQTSGGHTESRVDAGVSEPPPAAAPAPEAAPETRCPPAVEAMALCDRMARAERR